jgi:WD40 repeat protein
MAIGVPGATPFGGHAGVVKCVAFSPDGATFVTGGEDGVLRLWDLAAREQIAQFLMAREGMRWGKYVWAVAFSPDGGTVITVGGDRAIRLWDADGGSQRAKLDGHTGTVHLLAYSPDGTAIATGGEDHTVRVWDAATGASTAEVSGHTGKVKAIAYSPDGVWLATVDEGSVVHLWDTAAWPKRRALETRRELLAKTLAYSPDGTLIVRGRRAGRAVPSGAGAAGDPGRASGVRATGFLAGA